MTVELWGTVDRTSLAFIEAGTVVDQKRQGTVESDAELIWTVDADSWEEAMTLYHQYMGWEPYKPMAH